MSDLTVRPARPSELDTVGDLTLRAYRADGQVGDSYATVLADARSRARDAELLVAVDAGDRLLGTVTIALPGTPFANVARPGELEFRMLAVDPPARRRGAAAALVRAVLARARELAAGTVVLSSLQTMSAAHRLYERHGFRRAPARDWPVSPTIPLLVFVLDLSAELASAQE